MTPRADAQRNRARVLAAAETVFAAKGLSAPTEEIARRAGVGVGTVFRHFPTKEALLHAVLTGRLQGLADQADALADADDPGEALFGFFTRAVEQASTRNAFVDALADAGMDAHEALAPVRDRLRRAVGTLLIRAQRSGAVRDDVQLTQLFALLAGVSRAAEHVGWDDDLRAGTLAIVFDGLRPARHRAPEKLPETDVDV